MPNTYIPPTGNKLPGLQRNRSYKFRSPSKIEMTSVYVVPVFESTDDIQMTLVLSKKNIPCVRESTVELLTHKAMCLMTLQLKKRHPLGIPRVLTATSTRKTIITGETKPFSSDGFSTSIIFCSCRFLSYGQTTGN